MACGLDDESVMRQEREPVGITQAGRVVRVSLDEAEPVAYVRRRVGVVLAYLVFCGPEPSEKVRQDDG